MSLFIEFVSIGVVSKAQSCYNASSYENRMSLMLSLVSYSQTSDPSFQPRSCHIIVASKRATSRK